MLAVAADTSVIFAFLGEDLLLGLASIAWSRMDGSGSHFCSISRTSRCVCASASDGLSRLRFFSHVSLVCACTSSTGTEGGASAPLLVVAIARRYGVSSARSHGATQGQRDARSILTESRSCPAARGDWMHARAYARPLPRSIKWTKLRYLRHKIHITVQRLRLACSAHQPPSPDMQALRTEVRRLSRVMKIDRWVWSATKSPTRGFIYS